MLWEQKLEKFSAAVLRKSSVVSLNSDFEMNLRVFSFFIILLKNIFKLVQPACQELILRFQKF